jgi:hypothetical protein
MRRLVALVAVGSSIGALAFLVTRRVRPLAARRCRLPFLHPSIWRSAILRLKCPFPPTPRRPDAYEAGG